MAQKPLTLPATLSIQRGIVISDALLYNDFGDTRTPVHVVRHGVRGTQNVNNAAQRNVTNILETDSAKLDPRAQGLLVEFSVRFMGLNELVTAINADAAGKPFCDAFRDFLTMARESRAMDELTLRYARNIANGRFLWRNRQVASTVRIEVLKAGELLASFDALSLALDEFANYSDEERRVASELRKGLLAQSRTPLVVRAYVRFGQPGTIEVYPSQNYLAGEKPSGFARSLYCVGEFGASSDEYAPKVRGQAALRDQKISNALRTFDTWYPDFKTVGQPIAIEPEGANLQFQTFYRPKAKGAALPFNAFELFKLVDRLDPNSDDPEILERATFLLACVVRGGVYTSEKPAKTTTNSETLAGAISVQE